MLAGADLPQRNMPRVTLGVTTGPSKPRHALLAGLGLLRCNFATARRSPTFGAWSSGLRYWRLSRSTTMLQARHRGSSLPLMISSRISLIGQR